MDLPRLEISQIYSADEQNIMEEAMSAIPGANETFYWIGMKRNTRLVFKEACFHTFMFGKLFHISSSFMTLWFRFSLLTD